MAEIVTRWPGAVLRPAELTMHLLDTEGHVVEERQEPCWEASPARGSRRHYDFEPHRAAWRNFSETLLPDATPDTDGRAAYDPERLQAFIRKYGPLYRPANDRESYGSVRLACQLRTLAEAWNDDPELSMASFVTPGLDPAWGLAWELLSKFRAHGQLDGLLVRAAVAHLAGIEMRRCVACHNWIVRDPWTRRYCGPSCRTLAAQQRTREG
jgi:hypothetical protein